MQSCNPGQVYRYHNQLKPLLLQRAKKLREIYSRMRHPGAVVLTVLLWLHPLMTLDRLILACTLTSYTIGRHDFDESHYEYAEKHFTVQFSEKIQKSYLRNENIHSHWIMLSWVILSLFSLCQYMFKFSMNLLNPYKWPTLNYQQQKDKGCYQILNLQLR